MKDYNRSRSISQHSIRNNKRSISPYQKKRRYSNSRERDREPYKMEERRDNISNRGERKRLSRSRSPNQKYYKKTSRENSAENKDKTCVYVTNLNKRIKEYELEDAFKKYGSIKDVSIVKDPFTKESRGFGFVYYENNKQAEDAIAGMTGTELQGRQITCEISKRNKGRTSTPGIYLGPSSAKRMRTQYERPRYNKSRSRSYGRRRPNFRRYEGRSRSASFSRERNRGGDRFRERDRSRSNSRRR